MVMRAYKPAENLSELPREAIVRWPTINLVFPVSKSSWDAGVKECRYPQPVRIGVRGIGWVWGGILDMLDNLPNRDDEAEQTSSSENRMSNWVEGS